MPYPLQNQINSIARRLALVTEASRAGFKPPLQQLREMLTTSVGANHLTGLDYHALRLYDADFHPHARLEDYGSQWLKEWIHAQLNNVRWEAIATDKALTYALFDTFDLPYPEVYAIATPYARTYTGQRVLNSRDELANFLRRQTKFPMFCKPIKGSRSVGSWRIDGYCSDDDSLLMPADERMPVTQFINALEDPTGFGLVFQHAVSTSEALKPYCGNAVTGCRIIMLLHDDGARAFRVIWKIPTGNNITNTFEGGRRGNLMTSINPSTGRVERVLQGAGVNMRLDGIHPETGADLIGLKVPGWDDTLAVVTRATECFPGFRWQHWDVGFTDRGPVLFELNSAGSINSAQMSSGRGILDEELRAFIATYGAKERRGGLLFPESSFAGRRPQPAAEAGQEAPRNLPGAAP